MRKPNVKIRRKDSVQMKEGKVKDGTREMRELRAGEARRGESRMTVVRRTLAPGGDERSLRNEGSVRYAGEHLTKTLGKATGRGIASASSTP